MRSYRKEILTFQNARLMTSSCICFIIVFDGIWQLCTYYHPNNGLLLIFLIATFTLSYIAFVGFFFNSSTNITQCLLIKSWNKYSLKIKMLKQKLPSLSNLLLLHMHVCLSLTPSHYLNYQRLIDNYIYRYEQTWVKFEFKKSTKLFIHDNTSEDIVCEMAAHVQMGIARKGPFWTHLA